LRQDSAEWLSPPDPSINYNIARDSHHKDTAQWFTESSTFRDWKESGSLLWIHGKRTFLHSLDSLFSNIQFHSWIGQERPYVSQPRFQISSSFLPGANIIVLSVLRSFRILNVIPKLDQLTWHIFSLISRIPENRIPVLSFLPSSCSSVANPFPCAIPFLIFTQHTNVAHSSPVMVP
jgi:hypothetical protein